MTPTAPEENGPDLKARLMRHYVRIKKVSGVATLGLLIINQAILVYGLLEWRGLSPYIAVPAIVLLLGATVLVLANVLVVGMGFYHSETSGQVTHTPTQVYALNPWQEMVWRELRVPHYQALGKICQAVDLEEDADRYRQLADKVERWCELGYIPRAEFPAHLEHHYLMKEGKRL